MSDTSAIAAVTATLQDLIEQGLKEDTTGLPEMMMPQGEVQCTTLPPDKANEENDGKNRINLFLYQTEINAALRNLDLPREVKSGENGYPPLALKLYYLITAYREDRHKITDHLLLGQAMRVLHDHPFLDRRNLSESSGLQAQMERVKVTPQPMSVDEMSKLWTTFQTQYRVSAAYEVSVVLIDSQRSRRAPLPVLKRGRDDRGAYVWPSPAPIIREIQLPQAKPSAELGDTLTLRGDHLDMANITVRCRHLRFPEAGADLTPLPGGTATEIAVKLPEIKLPSGNDDPQVMEHWPAGIYTVSIVVNQPGLNPWTTNELPFALGPQIEITDPASGTASPGDIIVTLLCRPARRLEQRVALLFGQREILLLPPAPDDPPPPPPDLTQPTLLRFEVPNVAIGEYVLRLRVDGVDSIPLDYEQDAFQFDPNQMIKVVLG